MSPPEPPENPSSHARQFYDRISGAYDLLADANEHASREKGLEVLAVQEGERVLEVGFGTGHSLVALADSVGKSGHVDGVDISKGMAKVAARRLEKHDLADRVAVQVAAVPPLSYPGAVFDAVAMSFTLELFPLEIIPEVLSEVRRVLRPGGRFSTVSMATAGSGEQDSILERTYKWMHRHFPHIVDCQPIEAERLVRDAGFTVTACHRLSLWTMPVAVILARP